MGKVRDGKVRIVRQGQRGCPHQPYLAIPSRRGNRGMRTPSTYQTAGLRIKEAQSAPRTVGCELSNPICQPKPVWISSQSLAREDLNQRWSTSLLFEITSFEKIQSKDQTFYIIDYRLQESPDHCELEVLELVAVGSYLPGPAIGYRLRHRACGEWLPADIEIARRKVLESFRVVTDPDPYYGQFISRPGVSR